MIKRFILTLLALQFFYIGNAKAQWANLAYTSVRMQSEYQVVNGLTPFWLLVEFKIKPHWHTYWLNPGDSGMAPKFNFNLPEGFHASAVYWLPPQRFPAGSFTNYGYADNAYHLIQITPSRDISGSIIPIELHASWLVCETECIPEETFLSLHLQKGENNIASSSYDRINTLVAKTQLPLLQAKASSNPSQLRLMLDKPLEGSVYFFPEQRGIIDPGLMQTLSIQEQNSLISISAGPETPKYPIQGILEVTQNEKSQFYAIKAGYTTMADDHFLPMLLLFAVLGGLILNLMPCVFPILSLKVLALKNSSNKRLLGIFYTLGVISAFCAIAVIMLVIRSLGNNIGWGFQLQSPLFNIGLIYLFTLIALNLFGFFEIPFSLNSNLKWQNNHKYLYAYATGVLACVVATPCSAPFMATAVGVALGKDALTALLIFSFLGLGLALPYLLVCFLPILARQLPKPGVWMETIKQFLAFPMLLSVIWLLWVLGQQVPFNTIILMLISLCALLFTFWVKARRMTSWSGVVLMLSGVILTIYPLYSIYQTAVTKALKPVENKTFSMEKLNQLQAEGKRVFVYATAAWCITCKVNEQLALDTAIVNQFFIDENIHILKADWTNKDHSILQYLQSFGRAGVPLYVYYSPDKPPVVLPQLLTTGIIINTIQAQTDEQLPR